MSKQWLKLPSKKATCSLLTTCKVPIVTKAASSKFLGDLEKKGFDKEGLSELSRLLQHSQSGGQSGGNKTRRLCAIVIVGLLASGAIVVSKSAVHQSLIQTGLLPQLCGTSFLERLAHDYVASEVGGVLTCDQKAALWRHSANSILGVVTAAGIGPRMILTNFKEAVTQVEGLIDEWLGGNDPTMPKTPSKSKSASRSRSRSASKKSAAARKSRKASPSKTKKQRSKSRSRSRSRSRGKDVTEAISKMLSAPSEKQFEAPSWKFSKMGESLGKMTDKLGMKKKSPRHSRKAVRASSRKVSVTHKSRSRSPSSSDGSEIQ